MNPGELKAKLDFLANLSDVANAVMEEIANSLNVGPEDDAWEILEDVKEGCYQGDTDSCIKELVHKGYCVSEPPREPRELTPYIKYDSLGSFEIGVTYPEGDKLAAYLCESDFGTYQTGSMYRDKNGYPIDISCAEIKREDLALLDSKGPENNKDIDVMVWADPFEEDYTEKFTLRNEDIEEALETNAEKEER